MLTFSLQQAIGLIKQGKPFSGEVAEAGFYVKIEEYLPVVCTAIHAGHNFRTELQNSCLLTKGERFFEEDPFTDEMIASQPITLVARDSRFEYDLNRPKSLSTYYKSAWKKQVWSKPLKEKLRSQSQQKHQNFYLLYEALIEKLESLFAHVIVFDLHSYNYKRIETPSPVFNIGTEQIDMERWGQVVRKFKTELNRIQLPNLGVQAKINEIFAGKGYLIAHTNAHFDRTLVLPTEVKKVFMDEETGAAYPLVLDALKLGLKDTFSHTSAWFVRKFNKKPKTTKANMLGSVLDKSLLQLDKQLFDLAKGVDTLKYVNPLNLQAERRRFFRNPERFEPRFKYRQLPINPNEFKERLYRLPVEQIEDPGIHQLYSQVVENLSVKIDLLASVGQHNFVYNSLRYYGQPGPAELENANFLLHAQDYLAADEKNIDAVTLVEQLQAQAKKWQLNCKISTSDSIAAKAMVTNPAAGLLINKSASFNHTDIAGLIQHELGVHVATTLNARQQPLRVFRLGLPGATFTQEGLAIWAEFTSGNLPLSRLKMLAARVIAVQSMLTDKDFYSSYQLLRQQAELPEQEAFTTCARVYRGGGFTKDYLYLRGFIETMQLAQNRDLTNLLVGKTGFAYLDLVDELVGRDWLQKPEPLIQLQANNTADPIYEFLNQSMLHCAQKYKVN